MLINVFSDARTFHLRSRFFSYILTIMENGQIENLYFGKAIQDRPSFAHLHEEAIRGMTAFNAPEPSCLCLNQTRQEYPSYGTTDFRSPAFEVEQQNGSRISAFKFSSYKILKGKPSLAPLPAATMESDGEGETLILNLDDEVTGLTLKLSYSIYAELPILARNAEFELDGGAEAVTLPASPSTQFKGAPCKTERDCRTPSALIRKTSPVRPSRNSSRKALNRGALTARQRTRSRSRAVTM